MSTTFINKNNVNQNIYTFDGFWRHPDNDGDVIIHYYVSSPLGVETMNDEYQDDKARMTIIVGGDFPMAIGDIIVLDSGDEMSIVKFTKNQVPVNRHFRDILKPQYRDMTLTLE